MAVEKPYMTYDFLLYTVKWDQGEVSKHYEKDLIPLGASRRSRTLNPQPSFWAAWRLKLALAADSARRASP